MSEQNADSVRRERRYAMRESAWLSAAVCGSLYRFGGPVAAALWLGLLTVLWAWDACRSTHIDGSVR